MKLKTCVRFFPTISVVRYTNSKLGISQTDDNNLTFLDLKWKKKPRFENISDLPTLLVHKRILISPPFTGVASTLVMQLFVATGAS